MTKRIIVSNSEVSDFMKCERLWYYKYFKELTPIGNTSEALAYGNYGHDWLYRYYRTLASGANTVMAMAEANNVLRELQKSRDMSSEFLVHLMTIMVMYVTNHPYQNMKIIGVEQKEKTILYHDTIHDTEVYLGIKYDLLLQGTEGKQADKFILVDHKFKYSFISPEASAMNAQLPKYIYVLRQNGYNVETAMFNQLRYRKMDDDNPKNQRFHRLSITPTDNEISEAINDHITVASRIIDLRETSHDVGKIVTRSRDYRDCENCPFFSICLAQAKGKQTEALRTVQAFFRVGGNKYIDDYKELLND